MLKARRSIKTDYSSKNFFILNTLNVLTNEKKCDSVVGTAPLFLHIKSTHETLTLFPSFSDSLLFSSRSPVWRSRLSSISLCNEWSNMFSKYIAWTNNTSRKRKITISSHVFSFTRRGKITKARLYSPCEYKHRDLFLPPHKKK